MHHSDVMRQSIVHVALVVRDYDEAIEFMFLPRGSRYVAMLLCSNLELELANAFGVIQRIHSPLKSKNKLLTLTCEISTISRVDIVAIRKSVWQRIEVPNSFCP